MKTKGTKLTIKVVVSVSGGCVTGVMSSDPRRGADRLPRPS